MTYYYSVLFEEENKYDVVADSQLIYDGEDKPIVGQFAQTVYRSKLYDAKIVFISESEKEANRFIDNEILKYNQLDEDLGRGRREKKRKVNEDNSEKPEEKKRKESSFKDLKRRELFKVAKEIKATSSKENQSCHNQEHQKLQEENLKLKRRILELEKENKTAIVSCLKQVQNMISVLAETKSISTSAPTPSRLPQISPPHPKPLTSLPSDTQTNSPERYVQPNPLSLPENLSTLSSPKIVNPTPFTFSSPTTFSPPTHLPAQSTPPAVKHDMDMEGLLHKGPSSDVVELVEKSGVFVARSCVTSISISAKTHCGIARMLMLAVFDQKSLKECSLTGKASNGKNGEKPDIARPGLNGRGLKAIIDGSTALANSSGLRAESKSNIMKALGTRLSELRRTLH